ncbi:DNA-binding LytR/AlgR family response regulator [Bradyrhizobium elkanii]|nr:DNA-binding LytR/AlgR family response regulator [Bradyrhizobium elkanii]
MIAMIVEDTIEMMGFQIVGPVAKLDDALDLAISGEFDCAVLDINIRGGNSYAVADLLLERGCPFLFTTGYSDWSMPKHLVGETRLTKPYSSSQLESELRRLCLSLRVNGKEAGRSQS